MASSTRTRVHGVVLATPGLSVRAVADRVALDETTAGFHLRKLKAEQKVSAERRGRELLWYPAGHGLCPVLRRAIPLLRDRVASDVAGAFDQSPLTCTEVFRRTGHSERRIRTVLGQLERAGLVERTPSGRAQFMEGARTCLANARDAVPCALWGTCPVSAKWSLREVASTSSPSPCATGAARDRSTGPPRAPSPSGVTLPREG